MTQMPSPQRRRLPGRAAVLVLALASGAAFAPIEAAAVLLWKRKDAREPAATGQPFQVGESGVHGLAASAAAVLGAPSALPTPREAANYAHEERKLEEAQGALRSASSGEERALALVGYGNALASMSRDGAAGLAYVQALQENPGLQAAWNNLGSLVRRAGDLALARQVYESVLASDPESGRTWFNLAITLEAMNDLDGADAAYLNALSFAPELWTPVLNPLIVGNRRAQDAIHRRYLHRSGRGSILLEDGR